MYTIAIKQELLQEIESTSESLLLETLDFFRFLKTKRNESQVKTISQSIESELANSTHSDSLQKTLSELSQLPYSPASGRSILRHAGTWVGDNYQECLELVYTSRGKAQFDYFEVVRSPTSLRSQGSSSQSITAKFSKQRSHNLSLHYCCLESIRRIEFATIETKSAYVDS